MKLIHYGSKYFEEYKFDKIKNFTNKPRGGLWCSPINSENGWYEWCTRENFRNLTLTHSFVIEIKGNILVIGSINDIKKLPFIECKCFPIIDFVKLSKEYDAIHLTLDGLYVDLFDLNFPSLYGWDCESVLVLNKECVIL